MPSSGNNNYNSSNSYSTSYWVDHTNNIVTSSGYWSSHSGSTASWGNAYSPPQKPAFVIQMEEAIAEGERQEKKAKEKLWQDWFDSKMKESLY